MEAYAVLPLVSHALCQCVPLLPAAGPVKVAGRSAEIPPTVAGYPNQIARARVRVRGGKDKGPDDRRAVA